MQNYFGALNCLAYLIWVGEPQAAWRRFADSSGLRAALRRPQSEYFGAVISHLRGFDPDGTQQLYFLKQAMIGYRKLGLDFLAALAAKNMAERYADTASYRLARKFLDEAIYTPMP